MKKINVTLVSRCEEEYPGCEDLLQSYAEINLVACYRSLGEAGLRTALDGSDVLLLDEAVIELEGPEKVHAIHADHPGLRTLQIIENNCENKTMRAISLGVRGMMERTSMVSMLRKAIMVLYSGETWMSRDMVQSLHNQTKFLDDRALWLAASATLPGWDKLN